MALSLRPLIIGAAVFTGALVFYRYSLQFDSGDNVLDHVPNLTGEGYRGEIYSATGELNEFLGAEHVLYYQKRRLTKLERPFLVYYDLQHSDGREQWRIVADTADVEGDDRVLLRGNVALTPLFAGAPVHSARTDELTADLNLRTLRTPAEVSITGENWQNTGFNFFGDLNLEQYSFTRDDHNGGPHATYFPADN